MRAKLLTSTNSTINKSIPKEIYANFVFDKTITWTLNDTIGFTTSLIERFSCDAKCLTVWTNNSMYQFELEFDFTIEFDESTHLHILRLHDKIEATDIMQKFPQIYGIPPYNPQENLLYYGFECSKGWYTLILDLSEKIQKKLNDNPTWKVQVTQVKEKFGELCFYADCNDEIQSIIDDTIIQCQKTCMYCGAKAKRWKKNNGYFTSCVDCLAKNALEGEVYEEILGGW